MNNGKKFTGIMIDISRGQVPKIKTLKEIIKNLSIYDINFFSLYIEHTFRYKKHPLIWKNTGAFSQKEIKELIEYCKQYNIEVIPSIQTLGHFEKILIHKEYAQLSETDLYFSLAPVKKQTYQLLEDIIQEIAETFESEYINIGGDEVWDIAQGKSKKYAEKLGGETELFLAHILKVKEIVEKYNKKMMMWGDMVLKYGNKLKKLPSDIILLNWNYSASDTQFFKKIISKCSIKGNQQIICTGVLSWNALFPDIHNAITNIHNFVRAATLSKKPIAGFMVTVWGDDGNFNFLGESIPGILFFSHLMAVDLSKLKYNTNLNNRLYKNFWGIKNQNISLLNIFLFFSEIYKILKLEDVHQLFKLYWEDPLAENIIKSNNIDKKLVTKIYKKALSYLNQAKKIKIKKNKSYFNEILYKIKIIINFLERILLSIDIKNLYTLAYKNLWNEKLVESNLRQIINIYKEMIKDILNLKKEYKKLWIRKYKKEGLAYNLSRFKNIAKFYKEKQKEIKKQLIHYRKPGGSLLKLETSYRRVIDTLKL